MSHSVTITLLNRELSIKCDPSMEQSLRASAEHLDQRLQKACHERKHPELSTVILLTALNLSYELLALKSHQDDFQDQIADKIDHIDSSLLQILEDQ